MELELLKLKIALLIPTRGDRKKLLANCLRSMEVQTLKPYRICLQDYEPVSEARDITQRYRLGYAALSQLPTGNCPLDLIAFIEDDDYYSPLYLETMAREWLRTGKPELIGTGYTIYYHLRLRKWFKFNHPRRASAMNTLIRPGLKFPWCEDNYAFTDLHLWNMSQLAPPHAQKYREKPLIGHVFEPMHDGKYIALGMKHGIGLNGGIGHIDRFERFNMPDEELQFLKTNCDEASFEFYRGMSEELRICSGQTGKRI